MVARCMPAYWSFRDMGLWTTLWKKLVALGAIVVVVVGVATPVAAPDDVGVDMIFYLWVTTIISINFGKRGERKGWR